MRLLPLALAALAVTALLAGCSDADEPPAPVQLAPDGTPLVAAALHNYTTLHPAGAPFVRTYAGALAADEAANSNSVPFGLEPPGQSTCCSVDMIPVTDLLQDDQLVALRLTLTWTNTAADHAGFDVAACLPWSCLAFNDGPDESQQQGEHTDVLHLITSGRRDFSDQGIPYQVGVRYSNAATTAGIPYSIQAEAFPVGDGLAAFDPYTLDVPDHANVTAELVGPFAPDGVSLALMVYDRDDRPIRWIPLSGPHGSRHALNLTAGSYVVIPMAVEGGFVRLSSDREPDQLRMERLQEEFSTVEVALVGDAQEHSGTFTYQAPPGTIDPFPVFLYGDGAAVQDGFGVLPDTGAAMATLRSSSGDIAVVEQRQVYGQVSALALQNCFQCNFLAEFDASNYVDDDGTYEVDWFSQGAAGSFVLFTARYLR
jgi:hypothetical protein